MANINRVIITGNLTRDPELQSTSGGSSVCSLGVAVNHRRKDQNGNWSEEANFFDVTVFGAQGQNCASYLSKGRPVAIDGRLRWSSWENKEGAKRSKVDIVAQTVQFLGSREDGGQGGPPRAAAQQANAGGDGFSGGSDAPADTSDFSDPAPASAGGGEGGRGSDDDIPF